MVIGVLGEQLHVLRNRFRQFGLPAGRDRVRPSGCEVYVASGGEQPHPVQTGSATSWPLSSP